MRSVGRGIGAVVGLAVLGVFASRVAMARRRRGRAPSRGVAARDEVQGPPLAGGQVPEAPRDDVPVDYALLLLALSIPFWLVGGGRLPIPVQLPVSALAFVNPVLAATILTYRREGRAGVRALLWRAGDYDRVRHKIWYLPALFLFPAIALLSYGLMRVMRRPLPAVQIGWLSILGYLLIFLGAALAEELGWMGYAFRPVQKRWGALGAVLLQRLTL
jgi:membrane protease YdiL (CAAX protease family)